MTQSKAFVDASHVLNELSHVLALLESENAKLRGWMLDALTVITNLKCLVHTMQAQKEWTDEETEFVDGTLSNNEFMTLDDLAHELGIEVE